MGTQSLPAGRTSLAVPTQEHPNEPGWQQLCDRGEDLVLCLDFAGGRAEAGFADLAANVPIEASFLHIGRMPVGTGSVGLLAIHVERWAGAVCRTGRPVRGVLGYCAGAGLATAMADALVDAGAAVPPVLLFDAITVTGTTLCGDFVAAVASSAEHLTAEEVDGARQLADDLLARCARIGLPAVAGQLLDRYRELMTRLAARLRIGPGFVDELVGDFAAYLSYLLVAGDGSLELRSGTPVFLSSREHEPDVEPELHLAFGANRTDLLRDAEVAGAVADLLDRKTPAPG